jgi:hypothetical protein
MMLKEIQIANIPIMVKSKYCSTRIKQNLKGRMQILWWIFYSRWVREKSGTIYKKNQAGNKILIYSKKMQVIVMVLTYVKSKYK